MKDGHLILIQLPQTDKLPLEGVEILPLPANPWLVRRVSILPRRVWEEDASPGMGLSFSVKLVGALPLHLGEGNKLGDGQGSGMGLVGGDGRPPAPPAVGGAVELVFLFQKGVQLASLVPFFPTCCLVGILIDYMSMLRLPSLAGEEGEEGTEVDPSLPWIWRLGDGGGGHIGLGRRVLVGGDGGRVGQFRGRGSLRFCALFLEGEEEGRVVMQVCWYGDLKAGRRGSFKKMEAGEKIE